MAARRRAQERDFNRRRRLVLDKGFDLAYNQKDTSFGECLLKWNIREGSQLERRQKALERQQGITVAHREQEKKRFVALRDQATREPTLLLERLPNADQYSDYVDFSVPRFMRPLETRQTKMPEFPTFSVFQAVKKRKRNPWEEAVKEDVQFRPTLCPCARLSRQDAEKLMSDWAQVNEMQRVSLGLLTDNRSAPARATRIGANPLGLPSRINSAMNHLAKELFEDIPASSGRPNSEFGSGLSLSDEEQQPVFITQMITSGQRAPGDVFEFERKVDKRKKAEKERAVHKQHVDDALISIYDLLDHKRIAGLPQVRNLNAGQPRGILVGTAAVSTRASTAASSASRWLLPSWTEGKELRTTCRTAESIQILLQSKRCGPRRRRTSVDGDGVGEGGTQESEENDEGEAVV